MRILNNFDTELKDREYCDAVQVHGKDGVILVQRYFFYWLVKGIIPLLGFVIASVPIIYFILILEEDFIVISLILLIIYTVALLIVLRYILHKYIDYKMDFTLVTKEGISTFKQFGIFNAKFKNLPAGKIRSVQYRRVGLWGNILSFGTVTIITDGGIVDGTDSLSGEGAGKIKLKYVKSPNKVGKEIKDLCIGGSNIHRFKISDFNKD